MGIVEVQRSDRAVLSSSDDGQFHCSAPSRPRARSYAADFTDLDGEVETSMPIGMKPRMTRQCQSLLRVLQTEAPFLLQTSAEVEAFVARLQDVNASLAAGNLSLPGFATCLNEVFDDARASEPHGKQRKAAALAQLKKQANDAMLHMEVPELLYAALDWPPQGWRGKGAEALVLDVSGRVELSHPLRRDRWLWLEFGIVDEEGIECVPRVPCRPQVSEPPSRVVRVHGRLHPDSCPRTSRLMSGLSTLVLAGSGTHRLSIWVRAQNLILMNSTLEVQMASLKLLCSVPDGARVDIEVCSSAGK